MPIYKKKTMRALLLPYSIVMFILLGITAFFNVFISAAGIVLLVLLNLLALKGEEETRQETEQYIARLSYRVKKVGEEALLEMPIGILLINDHYEIEWANPYISSQLNEATLIGKSLYDVAEPLISIIKQEIEKDTVTLLDRKYEVVYKKHEKLMYLFDKTEQAIIEKKYKEERPVIAIIYLDNYDEITKAMDDLARGNINSVVTSLLNRWANENGIYLKRVSSDRFVAFFNEKTLERLESEKFSILDDLRELQSESKMPLTLSIGVGVGVPSLPELGTLAQSSLDLALGRGGDQVAIKLPNGKVKFYGGKTNPVEKRTRVRARVISHALAELIQESDKVIIMGHKYPDMDAIGACIGIMKMASVNGKEAYAILDREQIDSGVQKLLEEAKRRSGMLERFIHPDDALNMDLSNALLIIVDTHKPSLVIDERLVKKIDNVVIIDHHRRSEEFVKNPLLVYMEPYASSTSELVTELLEYQPRANLSILEATALLAGIVVDTKCFSLRTGSRTFDAASYLRSKGADTILVQQFLKQSWDTYIMRSKIIERTEFYKEGIAIAMGPESIRYNQILIAQAADTLLSMENVEASFVISKREDGTIGISARSLGKVNVQLIMEALGGGGHLTNAAVQLKDVSLEEAEERLKEAIDIYFEGGSKE